MVDPRPALIVIDPRFVIGRHLAGTARGAAFQIHQFVSISAAAEANITAAALVVASYPIGPTVASVRFRFPEIPLIALTPNQGDLVIALDDHADRAMLLPLNPDYILATVSALIRRIAWNDVDGEKGISFGGFTVYAQSRYVDIPGGDSMYIALDAARLLTALIRAKGQFVPRETLAELFEGSFDPEAMVRYFVSQIRTYFRKRSIPANTLSTQHGYGYRLCALDDPERLIDVKSWGGPQSKRKQSAS